MKAEVFVLNYNGAGLLTLCLPSVLKAAQRCPVPCRVTVIDNCSEDNSLEVLRDRFKEVSVFKAKTNRVFCTYNEAVEASDADIVVPLNNDLAVDEHFLEPLIRVFHQHPDACFAAPQSKDYATGEYTGCLSRLELRYGLLWGTARFEGHEKLSRHEGVTMQCGYGAFRREYFLALHGYDDLYLPGTVEDSDLCFRAYRRGWKGYYCPDSVVYHIGQVSFKKSLGLSGIRRLNRRNLYLFVWKNIRSPRLMMQHTIFIPLHIFKYVLFGQFEFLLGFFDAMRRFPQALSKRREYAREPSVLSDAAIFSISRSIQ